MGHSWIGFTGLKLSFEDGYVNPDLASDRHNNGRVGNSGVEVSAGRDLERTQLVQDGGCRFGIVPSDTDEQGPDGGIKSI